MGGGGVWGMMSDKEWLSEREEKEEEKLTSVEMPAPVRTVTVSELLISSASSSISRCVAGLAGGTTEAILEGSPETTAILGGGAREGIGWWGLRCCCCCSGRATAAVAAEEVEVDAADDDNERCC